MIMSNQEIAAVSEPRNGEIAKERDHNYALRFGC
jgi:hypothetical protein